GGMVYFLISKIGFSAIVENVSKANPLAFITAVLMYLLQIVISTSRWSLLIETSPPFLKLYSLYLIGSFFSIFLPGLVGGDTVKAYYLNKYLKGQNASNGEQEGESPTLVVSIASVFMDRYIGLIAIILIVVLVFPFSIVYLKDTIFIWIVPLFFVAFASVSFIFLRFKIGQRYNFIANFYKYFSFYIKKKSVLINTLLLSFFTQITGMIAVYILSIGLGIKLTIMAIAVFLPIIILVSFIPISIAGIGLREGAFVFFFGIVGVSSDQALTLSILWFLSSCTASLFGLIEYLRIKKDSIPLNQI
ncbi:MAG: flippase-like domain-containing protein, partial [Thermodesulfovibrionales bacterium]|nr:flippase-like domain-containing protein [Thermodesulfovibrionales bacterium]